MTVGRPRFPRIFGNQSGATAVEFAIVAPALLALLLGVLWISLLMFTYASLHYTVEQSARCASIRPDCPAPATFYHGPVGSPPIFTVTNQPCGKQVSGATTLNLNVLLYKASIPLTAAACFP